MTLSVHGHHPLLMVPIALACAVVFIRNGDGREHARVRSSASIDERDTTMTMSRDRT